mmetsp:Transcript_70154/g.116535  ORF Transcript_70154/g.116535 Transcript_70154/m.116535 type:complete len:129 (+) Transcript_70154:161-547(+)
MAIQYLHNWAARDEQPWKFSTVRQSYLLRSWPDRAKIPAHVFSTHLLPYLQSLPRTSLYRTLDQAKSIAEAEAEVAEAQQAAAGLAKAPDSEDEATVTAAERAALFKIRRARALKVICALLAVAETSD